MYLRTENMHMALHTQHVSMTLHARMHLGSSCVSCRNQHYYILDTITIMYMFFLIFLLLFSLGFDTSSKLVPTIWQLLYARRLSWRNQKLIWQIPQYWPASYCRLNHNEYTFLDLFIAIYITATKTACTYVCKGTSFNYLNGSIVMQKLHMGKAQTIDSEDY